MVTIFDLPVTPMSKNVHTSSAVLADPGNVGVAFGISLLLVYKLRYKYFRFSGRHLGFIISGYFNQHR